MLRRCFSESKLYQAFLQQCDTISTAVWIPNTSGSRGGPLCWVVHDQLQASLLGKACKNHARLAKTSLLILNKRKKKEYLSNCSAYMCDSEKVTASGRCRPNCRNSGSNGCKGYEDQCQFLSYSVSVS